MFYTSILVKHLVKKRRLFFENKYKNTHYDVVFLS